MDWRTKLVLPLLAACAAAAVITITALSAQGSGAAGDLPAQNVSGSDADRNLQLDPPPSSQGGRGSDQSAPLSRIPSPMTKEEIEAQLAQVRSLPRGEIPGTDQIDLGAPVDVGRVEVDYAAGEGEGAGLPSPSVGQTFAGVTFNSWIPPDDQIAAGPDHLVVPLNGSVAYFDKAGTPLFQTTLTDFWGTLAAPADFAFDPRIIYDHFDQRFILVALGDDRSSGGNSQSFYFVAVSNTSNPLDGWCMRRLDAHVDATTVTNNWADFPDVGSDSEAIYISSNQFEFGGPFRYTKLRILPKTGFGIGGACTGGITWWDEWDFEDADGGTAFTLRTAATRAPTQGQYILNADAAGNDFLTVRRVTNPLNPAGPTFEIVTIPVNPYAMAPDASQPGGGPDLDTNSLGPALLNAVSVSDRVWTVHTTACGTPATACIRWYQLNLSAWPAVTIDHQGTRGEPGVRDYFYPAIASDNLWNVAIVFARSGPNTFAEAAVTARLSGDAANTLRGTSILHAGEDHYDRQDNVFRNRWGDYGGASFGGDGSGEIWVLHQYADDPNHWDTWIGCINMNIGGARCAPPPPTPTPTLCNLDGWEENDTQPSAAPVPIPFVLAAFACPNDEDWFSFPLNAGDQVQVDATFSDVLGDIDIYLHAPNSTELAAAESATDNEKLTYTATFPGEYAVRVRLFLGVPAAGNVYSLDISSIQVGTPTPTLTPATPAPTATVTDTPAPSATPTRTQPAATATDTAPPTATLPPKLLGDVNADGFVNAVDGALVLQFDSGIIAILTNPVSGDVNLNGVVDAIDAALILQLDAGIIPSLTHDGTAVDRAPPLRIVWLW